MSNIITIALLPVTSQDPLSRFIGSHRAASWKRNDTGESPFADAGISSWIEWSSKNGTRLEVMRELPSPRECGYSKSQIDDLQQFPPTVQRFLFPIAAFRKYGHDCNVAMVDADTIVSPDAPSIFDEPHKADVGLIIDHEWNEWKSASCKAFAPLFPDVALDRSLYFNDGVTVLHNPILAEEFINFTLTRSSEFLSVMDGEVGTDQTPLNFLFQRLKKYGKLSACFLDPRYNVRMDHALATREPDQSRWSTLARTVVAENFISHFIMTKELMPAVWGTMRRELHPQDQPQNIQKIQPP